MSDSTATTLAVKYPHIEKHADGPAHLERIPRTRVSMIIGDYLGRGWSADEIARHYPYLQKAEIHAAFTYYFDHSEEIDREIREELEQFDSWQESPENAVLVAKLKAGAKH